MGKSAREAALDVLYACRRQGAWAEVALKRELAHAGLDSRDAALTSRLVYGVLQNQLLLDWYLRPLLTRPMDKMETKTADILRLGGYQLLLSDKIPSMAAVNESVELAKRSSKNPKTAGFVNAVLRNLDRSRDALPPLPTDPVERLSVRYSHPRWLVEEFVGALGLEETEELLKANNAPAPLTAQVNTLKTSPEELQTRLEAEGVTARPHPWMEGCLLLENTGNLEALPSFREGRFYIQDPAAREAVLAADPRPGMTVLDLCAAPGGKSFAAAVAMEGEGRILSRDLYPRKVKDLATSAARLGLSCIETAVGDATEQVDGSFDLVIADVPCSGLGIIRKKPDIRYKDPSKFQELPPIQSQILQNAARAVTPGGTLLYATCTLRHEENEDRVEEFLGKRKDFTVKTVQTLWPHRRGTDGFFYAALVREA